MSGKIQIVSDTSGGRYCICVHGDLDTEFTIIEPTIGARFLDELNAIGNGDGTVTVQDRLKNFNQIANVPYTDFIDEDHNPIGVSEEDTVNALNEVFQSAGSTIGPPVITSSLTVPATTSVPVNYFLEGTGIVGVEWGALPPGMAVNSLDRKNVLGLVSVPGTYPVSVTAVNAFGSDAETITFEVVATFENTKSIRFQNNDWMGGDAVGVSSVLGRAGDGSGAGDAWTISCWFKPGTSGNPNQTILFYGGDNDEDDGHVRLIWAGNQNHLRLRYGAGQNNWLQLDTPDLSLTDGTWHHIMVTYDGGTTSSVPAGYSRFEIWIDGVSQVTTDDEDGSGWAGSIDSDLFRIGRFVSGNHMRNGCLLEEVALWDSDQTANIAAIYNGGTTHDLLALGTPPTHWWRMGDEDTFPLIEDKVAAADFTMFNMTVSDIVSDVP